MHQLNLTLRPFYIRNGYKTFCPVYTHGRSYETQSICEFNEEKNVGALLHCHTYICLVGLATFKWTLSVSIRKNVALYGTGKKGVISFTLIGVLRLRQYM